MKRLIRLLWIVPLLYFAWAAFSPLWSQQSFGGGTQCVPDSVHPIIYQQIVMPWPAPPYDLWRMEYRALLEHEATHAEQLARYPSCIAMAAALEIGGVDTLLAWEAEAGCAQMRVYVAWGKDPRDLVGIFVARLNERIRQERPLPQILAALSRVCPMVETGGP